MNNKTTIKGNCLCGAVKLKAFEVHTQVGACHCSMCRKWGGGPLLTTSAVEKIEFEHSENIQVFSSSEWAERGFCNQCGTHLFYRLKQNGQHFIPIGLLDDRDDWNFEHQVFIDEKPEYYCFANKTHDLTGKEVFELFNSGS